MLSTVIKEIKEVISNKRIWIVILTVLIMIIIGTSYNMQNSEKKPTDLLRIGVINHDNSTYSELLLSYFTKSKTFSNFSTITMGEEKKVKAAFERDELDIYLEIPENFAMNMMRLRNSPIFVTLNITDTTKAILIQNVMKSYEKYIAGVEANAVGLYDIMEREGMSKELILETNRKVSIDLIMNALGKEKFFSYKPLEQFPTTSLLNYYISSFLVMTLLYSGLYVGFRVLREMKQGTFSRLRTTAMPLYHFLIAKMFLINVILAMISITAVSLLSGKLTNIEGAFFCIAIAIFSVSLAVFLSSLFYTTQRFVLAGNFLVFCFTIIGGGIIPIQFLPQDMVRISKITPFYYMVRGVIHTCQGQPGENKQITLAFILLSVLFMGMALFFFQRRSVSIDEV